LVYNHKIVAF